MKEEEIETSCPPPPAIPPSALLAALNSSGDASSPADDGALPTLPGPFKITGKAPKHTLQCPDFVKCRNIHCEYKHPRCRDDDSCRNPKCGFQHTDGRRYPKPPPDCITTLPPVMGPPANQSRDGDWPCPACLNSCFAWRKTCPLCSTPKPGEPGAAAGSKPASGSKPPAKKPAPSGSKKPTSSPAAPPQEAGLLLTVFVSGLTDGTTELEVRQFFEGELMRAVGRPTRPRPPLVDSITIKNGQAFVEFFDPVDADIAVFLSGNEFKKQTLSIRRLAAYIPPPGPAKKWTFSDDPPFVPHNGPYQPPMRAPSLPPRKKPTPSPSSTPPMQAHNPYASQQNSQSHNPYTDPNGGPPQSGAPGPARAGQSITVKLNIAGQFKRLTLHEPVYECLLEDLKEMTQGQTGFDVRVAVENEKVPLFSSQDLWDALEDFKKHGNDGLMTLFVEPRAGGQKRPLNSAPAAASYPNSFYPSTYNPSVSSPAPSVSPFPSATSSSIPPLQSIQGAYNPVFNPGAMQPPPSQGAYNPYAPYNPSVGAYNPFASYDPNALPGSYPG